MSQKHKCGKSKCKYEDIDAKFSKYMFCGNCKKKMSKRRARNFISIYCPSRNETNFLCSNNTLYKYEDLEQLIISSIRKEFYIYFKKRNLNSNLIKKYNMIKVNEIDNKLKELNKELGMLKFRISKLYNDRLQESISEESYKNIYNDLTKNRKKISEDIESLENEKEKINSNSKNISNIKEIKKILKNLDREILTEEDIGKLIEKIHVYNDHIHIFYNFERIP